MKFIDELKMILADELIAKITKTKEGLSVKFLDGRVFLISAIEQKASA